MTGNLQRQEIVVRGAAVALSAFTFATTVNAETRPVILLDTAITTTEERELFVRDTAPDVTATSRSYFGRLFTSLLPIKRYPTRTRKSDITTGAVGDSPFKIAEADIGIPADPLFNRWQADAQKRLKEENAVIESKPHPLAAAYPDSYVTVCEAGCPTRSDKIVFKVLKKEAANAQPRGFEPTGVEKSGNDKGEQVAESGGKTAEPVDPNVIDCVAGCYSRPKSVRALPDQTQPVKSQRRADVVPQTEPAKANEHTARRAALMPTSQPPVTGDHRKTIQSTGMPKTAEHHMDTRSTLTKAEPAHVKKVAAVRAKVQGIARRIARKPAWQTKVIRDTHVTPEIKDKTSTAETHAATDPAAKGKWKARVSRFSRVSMLGKKR